MFQTSDNSQLLRRVLWISAELTIVSSLKHKNTQPLCIFNRVRVLHLDRLKEGTWLHSFAVFNRLVFVPFFFLRMGPLQVRPVRWLYRSYVVWPGWVKCSPVPVKCKDNCMFFTQKRGTQLEHFPFFLFLSFGILVKYYTIYNYLKLPWTPWRMKAHCN